MSKLLSVLCFLMCNVGLFGQVSPIFPSRAVTDADMWVSSDVCSMKLAYPLGPTDTTIQVTTATGCPTSNFLIKVEKEVVGISSVSGVTLSVATSGRGYGGTIAAGHARGQLATTGYFSYQQNRDAAEIEALETFLIAGTGAAAWGHILGTLADQGDLAGALGGKQDILADYSTISGLTGYPSTFPPTTTGLALLASGNTFTAGAKQTMSQSATTAGINLGALASDPSGLSEGDFWYNSGVLKIRQGAATVALASTAQLSASVTGIRKSAGAGTTDTAAAAADVGALIGIANPSDTEVVNYVGTDGVQHRITQSGALPVVAFNPNTATSLTCPGTSGAQFKAISTLTAASSSIATISCAPATGYAAQVQIVLAQGATVYALTLPAPFNVCDFTQMTASDTMTESVVYDGTNVVDGTCTLKNGAGTVVTTAAQVGALIGIANPSDTRVVNYIGTDGTQHRIAQSGGSGAATSYVDVFDGSTTTLADSSTVSWSCGSGSGSQCTTTWTVPAGVSQVRVVGWSGGSAGSDAPTDTGGGAGGSGGAYLDIPCATTAGGTVSIAVGKGGVTPAGSGGNTTFGSCFTLVGAKGSPYNNPSSGLPGILSGSFLQGGALLGSYGVTFAQGSNYCLTGGATSVLGYSTTAIWQGACGAGGPSTATNAGAAGGQAIGGGGAGGSGSYNNVARASGGTSALGGAGGNGGGWTSGSGLLACTAGSVPGGGGGGAASEVSGSTVNGCAGGYGQIRVYYAK